MDADLRVTKRNGKLDEVSFDKIHKRFKILGKEANIQLTYSALAMVVINQLYDKIPTTKIDELCAEECIARQTSHLDYGVLASRILITNHHRNTLPSKNGKPNFFRTMQKMNKTGILSPDYWLMVQKYKDEWEKILNYERDFLIDYFGFKTLEKSYLTKVDGVVVERPQHMWLRVAIAVSGDDFEKIQQTYDLMSQKYYTHATPTLFNAGMVNGQYSSCFLVSVEDSIEGIYNTLKECAVISKYAGGIGLHIHNIRAKGTHIHGTNGTSNGLIPMMRVFNETANYVDQGGGKRNGSIALYLEPWHADVVGFLNAKRNQGDEKFKSRELFYALWIPDLFMKRVLANQKWSLFCPHECPGLSNVFGDEFDQLYQQYEQEGRAKETISATDLWTKILDSQMETGTPYLLYKDSVNRKTNQSNVGVIRSSNLCTEIMEYSDKNETAVCNLASIGLPCFVQDGIMNYNKLHQVVKIITENLNRVIDQTFYPIEKARVSNLRHRPIGIGVQGLADVFALMNIPFCSDMAREVNRNIFETIYHAALTASMELAKLSEPYSSFIGSPASKGMLQFDLWGIDDKPVDGMPVFSGMYDWPALKAEIIQHGLLNSLLVAPMPTASTSQILGFNECFEPFTSNIYNRRTMAGEFTILNKYMIRELMKDNQWTDNLKNSIIKNKGSVQHLTQFPQSFRDKYKIAWEIPQKFLIDMAVDRGPFICQSQSMNLWMEEPTYQKLHSMHFYSWQKGLKTGIYYLRTKAKHQAEQFTIEPTLAITSCNTEQECTICSA
jgi:ribonucleoside-diphosphate reductase alpha chain